MEFVTSDIVLQEEILPDILRHDILSLDVETTGFNPRESVLVLVQIATPEEIYVFDARACNLTPLFSGIEQVNPLIIGHNLKFDLKFLKQKYNFTPKRLFDTMLAWGIIYNGKRSQFASLHELTLLLLGETLDKDLRASFQYTYGDVTEEQIKYAANDVRFLYNIFREELTLLKQDDLIATAKLEFSLIPVVVDLELTGIRIDRNKWEEIIARLPEEIQALEQEIGKMLSNRSSGYLQSALVEKSGSLVQTDGLPVDFNPRSNLQVRRELVNFGYNVDNVRASTLRSIPHPFARAILKHRNLAKIASTYGKNFLALIESDGKIHANFNQNGSRSGRFSSSNPNLQNIPRSSAFRGCFIADAGCKFITADFSQIELRTAAVLSGEPKMLEEYSRKDADLHRRTASYIYKIPVDKVTSEQRSVGKNGNFSIIYQISPAGFASRYEISIKEAERIISGFWSAYDMLHNYMLSQGDLAVTRGYTKTAIGRRRYFLPPSQNSRMYRAEISKIRREGANFPVQGTAADIMKLALIKVREAIMPYGASIVNTVHDELVVNTPEETVAEVAALVYNEMINAAIDTLGDELPWEVNMKIGNCWEKA